MLMSPSTRDLLSQLHDSTHVDSPSSPEDVWKANYERLLADVRSACSYLGDRCDDDPAVALRNLRESRDAWSSFAGKLAADVGAFRSRAEHWERMYAEFRKVEEKEKR